MLRAFCAVVFIATPADSALAQTPAAQEQSPSMEELLRRMDALQHRVDELESSMQTSMQLSRPASASPPLIVSLVLSLCGFET
jgi:hypothetical protein